MAKPIHTICSIGFIPILTATFLITIPEVVHSRTLDSDIEVLRSLKQCIDPSSIPIYSFLSTWNFDVDPCENNGGNFLGILCTIPFGNYTSRVTGIELDGVGYDGFLTPTIGNLTELFILNLSKNKFRGPLPGTIANLNSLNQLSLSENVFTGTLPSGITSLKHLELIDVSHNKLTGSIPSTIIGLRRLLHLSLSNNAFSGRIPNLGALWRLQVADLSINQFSGNLPNFPTNLQTLSLRNNRLSGHINSLGSLKHLRTLDLSDNRFSGTVTDDIFLLPELNHLNVSVNSFKALEVIEVSGRPTQLRTFEAQQNNLHGHLPRNLVTYENLTSINLRHNQISGNIPVEYGRKLTGPWKSLFLDYNFLRGNLPSLINRSTRIQGSLAHNCLMCPVTIPLCSGGQRPASECVDHMDDPGN